MLHWKILHVSKLLIHLVSKSIIDTTVNHCDFLYTGAIYSNQNAHLVTLYSNGQGVHYLSANNYNYYVVIDLDNNIQALPAAEIDNVNVS